MLVEDDADSAESTATLRRLCGHQVRVAPDGPCALGAGPAFQPHVVLLDLGLPGMDGLRVARPFREQPAVREATLVALTGFGDDANCRRSRQAGIERHLVKPVAADRLQALLSEMAGEREFPREAIGSVVVRRQSEDPVRPAQGGTAMLVLTRQVGETIVIDGAICVMVVAVKGDKVRLGVSAPASVPVDRSEVHERRRASGSGGPTPSVSSAPEGESSLPTAQPGDRVQVHYVIRSQDGSVASSRGRAPLELTVGTDHPRLPGLGLELVGLAPGEGTTLTVPPERAYGLSDPARIRRWSRRRFPKNTPLRAGSLVRVTDQQQRRRLVRVVQVRGKVVVVDANHRWAGQTLQMEVELVTIRGPGAADGGPASGPGVPRPGKAPTAERGVVSDADSRGPAGLAEGTVCNPDL